MKKTIYIVFCLFMAQNMFSLDNETPVFIIELSSGYAFGINLPNRVPVDIKLMYPINRFGFTVEAGALISDNNGYHIFFGPTFFVINNPRIRLPISLGFNVFGTERNNLYYGIGIIPAFHYSIHRNIFFSLNLNINYAFNNPYDVTVGYEDAAIGVDEDGNKIYPIGPGGNPILTRPVRERQNHFGNYIFIKPTIGVGIQF